MAVLALLGLHSLLVLSLALGDKEGFCPASMSLGALKPGKRPDFLLFGDSLTQRSFEEGGWGTSLTHHYARKADIINRGLSGYNSRWAKYILPRVLETRSQPPALLTIWFGANDAVLPDRPKKRQYVPISEYKSTLEEMVQVARDHSIRNILLITPPPVDEAARIRWNQQADGVSEATSVPERTTSNTQQYAAACRQAAQAAGVPVLDMFSELPRGAPPDWTQSWLNDGLHFSSSGQHRVFELVLQSIEAHFADLRVENLPDDFPHHSLVNETDPESSIVTW